METYKEEIKKRGIKKAHIAGQLKISPALFSLYLNEKRKMPEDIKFKLERYLGL